MIPVETGDELRFYAGTEKAGKEVIEETPLLIGGGENDGITRPGQPDVEQALPFLILKRFLTEFEPGIENGQDIVPGGVGLYQVTVRPESDTELGVKEYLSLVGARIGAEVWNDDNWPFEPLRGVDAHHRDGFARLDRRPFELDSAIDQLLHFSPEGKDIEADGSFVILDPLDHSPPVGKAARRIGKVGDDRRISGQPVG